MTHQQPVLAASIQAGVLTLANGQTIDLNVVQAACRSGFQETGNPALMQAAESMSELTDPGQAAVPWQATARNMARQITGVVQKVEYTHGAAGNQFTTIDGVRYTTFWDIRTRDWQEGDKVQFTAVERSLWEGHPKVLHAERITKVI